MGKVNHVKTFVIGRAIKKRRKSLGWTQRELADRLGYKSLTTISKIETGVNDLNMSTLSRIATVLGVSVNELSSMANAERIVMDGTYERQFCQSAYTKEEMDMIFKFADFLVTLRKPKKYAHASARI